MKGYSGMGMRKHGRSGRSGKSPKLRLALRRDAEKNERRAKKYPMVARRLLTVAQKVARQVRRSDAAAPSPPAWKRCQGP